MDTCLICLVLISNATILMGSFFLIGPKLNVIKRNPAIRFRETENDGKITGKFATFGIWSWGDFSRTLSEISSMIFTEMGTKASFSLRIIATKKKKERKVKFKMLWTQEVHSFCE